MCERVFGGQVVFAPIHAGLGDVGNLNSFVVMKLKDKRQA